MSNLAIIGGSSFRESKYFKHFELFQINTEYGPVQLRKNKEGTVFFVQRHEANPLKPYTPPHLINKRGIIQALQKLGVGTIIGFGSTGSLKPKIPVGTLLVPDDYMCPAYPVSFYDDARGHIVPKFDSALREKIIFTLKAHKYNFVTSGIYVQTKGPRFETPAEIQSMAVFADIVGMTCAHEADLCAELKIPFAVICMVDNMANGIVASKDLSEEFHQGVKTNLSTMEQVLGVVLETFTPTVTVAGHKRPLDDIKEDGSKVVVDDTDTSMGISTAERLEALENKTTRLTILLSERDVVIKTLQEQLAALTAEFAKLKSNK